MSANLKTIRASGRILKPGTIEEYQQTCRDWFGIEPTGSISFSSRRGAGTVELAGVGADDVLDITMEDGIRLFVRRDDFEQDFVSAAQRSGGTEELSIGSLRLGPPSRSVGELLVRLLDVFRVPIAETSGVALCRKFEDKSLKRSAGLFGIAQADSLKLVEPSFPKGDDVAQPVLVFIHGTASSSEGSFGGLWEEGGAELRERLFKHYRNRVYALEHRTLSQSPIQNAIDLLEALPKGTLVHAVSHSRGGIVGELLCRGTVADEAAPFLPAELQAYRRRAAAVVDALEEGKKDATAAYTGQVELLEKLNGLLLKKRIRVERFVRVACPARGTSLASGRLDRWLSVFFNVVGLIPALRANPYFPLLENFIRALVKTRTKPQHLPGMEAQMPGSPLIGLLNASKRRLASDLTVIAGDIEHDSLLGRIALLLPDQFYDTEHDLVVNTPSMYGGSEREKDQRHFFDQGAAVNHFNYFRNEQTASRVVDGLILSQAELEDRFFTQLPEEAGPIPSRSFRVRKGPQPVVFLLPGIMGSELDERATTIWADKFRLALGGMARLRITRRHVAPSGLIRDPYENLVSYLSQKNEVVPFHYDWRVLVDTDQGIDEVQRLATAVAEKIEQALEHDQPVSILAHSMGGLLARLMMVRHRDVWDAMLQHPDSRLIMLGTPNGGSFSIARLLFGQEKLVKGLALIDIKHKQRDLLKIIGEYPGVLFMLPFGDERFDFFADETWTKLAELESKACAPPLPASLAAARELREQINTRPLGLEDRGRVLYVAGRAAETPVALTIEHQAPVFKGTPRGDGRVPWATGIPTGIDAWYMDAAHGDLANHRPGFEAISDLLKTGQTDRLPNRPPATARGASEQFDLRPDVVDLYPSDREIQTWALGASGSISRRKPAADRIKLRITHGNLAFSRHPVMVGHYNGDGLFSAERYLNKCLDGRLSRCHQLDLYPGPIGTAELIMNEPYAKPMGALIVGLGEVGKLTVATLSRAVATAVQRYAFERRKRTTDQDPDSRVEDARAISSLLVGASSGGLPLLDALMAILEGVKQANEKLGADAGSSAAIEELQIVELWEDRAILATKAADHLFSVNSELEQAYIYDSELEQVRGGHTRAFSEEEAGWWNRLQIAEEEEGSLSFHRIADKARTEKRLVATDRKKVDQFLQQATVSAWTNRALPKTLFEMLIPNELKDSAEELGNTVLMVTEESARYPWELLEDRLSRSGRPLAVQNRLIRQLEAADFRRNPKMSPGDRALVVGEPHLDNRRLWSPLKGAAEEGKLVAGVLASEGGLNVTKLINPDANGVLKAVLSESYRVMHLAGHGVHRFNMKSALTRLGLTEEAADAGDCVSGMVIGDNVFLDSDYIRQMRHVPELVFINCCHLARTDRERSQSDFGALAANLATQFIRMGARAVVAAGWEVDDGAAKTFAQVFYQRMIDGRDFGEAVFQARKQVFQQHQDVNTWGAYQCYGHPHYVLAKPKSTAPRELDQPKTPTDLITRLDNLSRLAETETDAGRDSRLKQMKQYLDETKNAQLRRWHLRGDVCAAIGRAYGEFEDFGQALTWYEKAAACEDATASIKDFEQHANLLVRHATAEAVERATAQAFHEAESAIERALQILDQIDTMTLSVRRNEGTDSVERESLRGSAFKRLAHIRVLSEADRTMVEAALKNMHRHYSKSDTLCFNDTGKHYYYPYTAGLQAVTILHMLSGRRRKLRPEEEAILRELRKNSKAEDRENPSFWNMVSTFDCELVLRINDGTLPKYVDRIADGYLSAKRRAASAREFRSIRETFDFLICLVDPKFGTEAGRKSRTNINKALIDIRRKLD